MTVETFDAEDSRPDKAVGLRYEILPGLKVSGAIGRGDGRSFGQAGQPRNSDPGRTESGLPPDNSRQVFEIYQEGSDEYFAMIALPLAHPAPDGVALILQDMTSLTT